MKETMCSCGSNQETPHKLGNVKCFRELIPKHEEPKPFGVNKILWKLPKRTPINDLTLKQSRGYSYHEETKRWSIPKSVIEQWYETKGWD